MVSLDDVCIQKIYGLHGLKVSAGEFHNLPKSCRNYNSHKSYLEPQYAKNSLKENFQIAENMITNNNFLPRLIGKIVAELLLYVNLAFEENSHADVFDYGVELSNLATIKLS